MKSILRFFKGITLTLIAFGATQSVLAQTLPVCSGTGAGNIYFNSHDSIFKMDPVTTNYTWTGVTMILGTPSSSALAISGTLASSPAAIPLTYWTTFLTGATRNLYYWNNATATWVPAGGGSGAVLNSDNIAGGGGFIYSYDQSSGFVFKYNGLGTTSTFVVGAVAGAGSGDIAADCAGNFYLLYQNATPAVMRKYTPAGVPTVYTLAGTYGAGGGGLAVNGNNVYYDGADGKLYTGVISGTTVTFSASAAAPFNTFPATDFGSCGYAGYNANLAATDTVTRCNGAANVPLTATGPGPYSWTVLSGPATIAGSGQTVIVSSPATSVITHADANCAGVNSIIDTTVIFVANATMNLGGNRTINSCGGFVIDSITNNLTNTSPGISYGDNWTPLASTILGTEHSPTVIFQITKTTTFIDTVRTIGCIFVDSVKIKIVDSTPKADFQWLPIHYGCLADTVCFVNTSRGGIDSFAWDFRDSVGNNGNYYYTDEASPCHIFHGQGFFNIKLLAKNAYCSDTVNKQVNLSHPVEPDFTIDDSTSCSNHLFVFKDKSKTPSSNPAWPNPAVTYKYDFGDGTSASLSNTTHSYARPGTYIVTLTLVDRKLGCVASKSHTIVIDSLPFARIISPDTIICQGQAIHLQGDFLTLGNVGLLYNTGDGRIFTDTRTLTYSYVEPGNYLVTFTAYYRYCDSVSFVMPVSVRPFPGIDLGPDTVLCPNGSPIILSDRVNLGNTAARYVWNTGETTPAIAARSLGTYWSRVDIGGCTATDSIVVNKDCYISIPNSFTPNGDGANDYFLPRQFLSRSVSTFKMAIFNRWGEKVFETATSDGRGWDGKFNGQDQPQGVYVYQIDVAFDNGVAEHYTGNVTLLR